eukprot:symbB.v1.2.026056.t2/scaffold2576.1/size75980/1
MRAAFQCALLISAVSAEFLAGVGIADVTGPAAEVVMMGYADQDQRVTGIHMRLHARAFIFVYPESDKRVVYLAVDTWAATESLMQGLESRLLRELPGLYSRHNVLIGPSHTHMGPAGVSPYYLYQISSFGYVKQSTQALIDGMVEAVKMAHNNIRPAHVSLAVGPVDNTTVPGCPMPHCASRNRSPTSYMHNPAEERANYSSNTDYDMDLIKIVDAKTGEPMGTMNWFSVHATSMKSTSGLISGDNKGYAQYAFEKAFGHNMGERQASSNGRVHGAPSCCHLKTLPTDKAINGPSSVRPAGRGPFVAGFGSAASGDISPNTHGSWCEVTGQSCETAQSVCYDSRGQPRNSDCLAWGPGGRNIFESTKVIGERQYLAARHIFENANTSIGNGIDYRIRYVDMTQYSFKYEDGKRGRTCPPAMSTTFGAGTTDGPSHVDEFGQNMTPTNGFLRFLGHLITLPPEEAKRRGKGRKPKVRSNQACIPGFPFDAMPELKVNSLQGHVLTLEVAMTESVRQLKAMILEQHPCEDPIERKVLKADILHDRCLLDDAQTLHEAGLEAESEVSVIYSINEMEAASQDDIHASEGFFQINLSEGLTHVAAFAFRCCCKVVRVTVPTSVVDIGSSAFAGCSSLESITFPETVSDIRAGAFKGCNSLKCIIIPDSVHHISPRVFAGCGSLKSVVIPDSVTYIGDGAFAGCNSLESIAIPGSVTCIGDGAFGGCSSLESIIIPDSVKCLGLSAFADCSCLESITMPNSVTIVENSVFEACSSLKGITIPDSVIRISPRAFVGCSSLKSITIPNSVTYIGDGAFAGCSSLESITIPPSVTSIGASAFAKCSSLESISMPASIRIIENFLFDGCSSLKSITIPDSVTHICHRAFVGCSSLRNITIPDSVSYIGDAAFAGCGPPGIKVKYSSCLSFCRASISRCHFPKDILLYTGRMKTPYPYMPSKMAFQLVRLGNLIIAGVPGEFTTMAGRRTAKVIKKALLDKGVVGPNARVVINNCASGYAGYVTTIEEYQHQRYEGGSTAYGPHTHGAMTNILKEMAEEMAEGKTYRWPGAQPKIPTEAQMMEGQSDVVADDPPIGGSFGDVKSDVYPEYPPGATAQAVIWGAHPRNNLRRNSSFVSVWRLQEDGHTWHMVADDNDWELRFEWKREGISASTVTITWEIPEDCPEGKYS